MIAALLKYKTIIAVVLIFVMALTIWLLWGQVGYAKDAANLAKEQVATLQTRIDALAADQKRTSEILTARLVADRIQVEKLAGLQSEINRVMKDDEMAKEWGNSDIPGSILERLRDEKD